MNEVLRLGHALGWLVIPLVVILVVILAAPVYFVGVAALTALGVRGVATYKDGTEIWTRREAASVVLIILVAGVAFIWARSVD